MAMVESRVSAMLGGQAAGQAFPLVLGLRRSGSGRSRKGGKAREGWVDRALSGAAYTPPDSDKPQTPRHL
jgi:hypothetical protein